jgi:hypothetical protein
MGDLGLNSVHAYKRNLRTFQARANYLDVSMFWRIMMGIACFQGLLFLGVLVGRILAFRSKPITKEEEERAAMRRPVEGARCRHRGEALRRDIGSVAGPALYE